METFLFQSGRTGNFKHSENSADRNQVNPNWLTAPQRPTLELSKIINLNYLFYSLEVITDIIF
jgi:hypothetical protein